MSKMKGVLEELTAMAALTRSGFLEIEEYKKRVNKFRDELGLKPFTDEYIQNTFVNPKPPTPVPAPAPKPIPPEDVRHEGQRHEVPVQIKEGEQQVAEVKK